MSTYNDNSVPFGSRTEVIKRGSTSAPTVVGTFIFESISLTRPSKIIERPNQIGEPNGWVAVSGFIHGTATIQIAEIDSGYPKIGDWFVDTFVEDDNNNSLDETFVIVEMTQPYAMADYWKCNVTLRLATNPP
jgi:hypothetical protein